MKEKLNLGCGTDIKEGWVNLDSAEIAGVDVVHNILNIPLPFNDGQFNLIVANDILEHVDYIPLMKELHRILKDGGILHIRVPHFTRVKNFKDPTHIR
jgi:predicted SAM-dependent methyltransferase